MAIEKNCFKVSRLDSECSPRSRENMSSDEEELRGRNSAVESDDDDEFDDADSGVGSDDFDLLELGETGAEFCQIGNQTCSIPLELYDLAGLEDILSVDVWNECLSEEERFELAKYLPDMDQETFVQTLNELFTVCNIHFGSPIKRLFDMLKGGLCEPRVALYREGLNFFQKRQHYHLLRKHQNNMVSNLCQIRDAWRNCRGYSIEERLRVLNIMRSQKSLMYEKMEDIEAGSSDEESSEGIWSMKNKDKKIVQKMGRYPFHGVGSAQEFPPQGRSVVMEQEKYGKQNPKGMLRFAGSKAPSVKDPTGRISSVYHALDMNPGLNGSAPAFSQRNKSVGYDSGSMLRLRDQLWNGDRNKEMSYGPSVHQDRNLLRSNQMDKSGVSRVGKRHDLLRAGGIDTDNLMALSLSSKTDPHGYTRNANQSADMKMLTAKSSKRSSYEFSRKVKYPENIQQFVGNDQVKPRLRGSQLPLNINSVNSADYDELCYSNETPGEEFVMDSSFKCDDWNLKGKKWKAGRESPDLSYAAYRSSLPQVSDRLLSSDSRAKSLQEKIRGTFMQNGGKNMALRGNQMLLRSEETESDSSEQLDDDEDNNPLLQGKYAYMMGTAARSRAKSLKSHLDLKKDKFVTDLKPHVIKQSKKKGSFSEQGRGHGVDNYLSKVKQKGEIRNGGPLHNQAGKFIEENYPSGSDMLNVGDDDWKLIDYKKSKNGRIRGEPFERLDMPASNAYTAERKKKGRTGLDHSNLRSKYLHEYAGDEDDSLERQFSVDDNEVGQSRYGRKGPKYASYKGDQNERSEAPLLGCSSVMKKRKMKNDASDIGGRGEDANLLSNTRTNDSTYLKRKSKKKTEAELVNSEMENSELRITDMRTADIELETKPQKKSFTLITPTVHTGFSFSIIHLLSAVRMAMISPLTEDSLEMGKPSEQSNKAQEGSVNGALSNKMAANCEPADQLNLPSLTVQEIVNHVRSNPGDPNILETQEPLQDLVRGVLKIFSSKTAPLGAKGWKVLAVYERTTKSWSWTGPVIHNSSDQENVEEVTSPEAWGLPYKMLVKLVDSFANWLKCGQETLQQIGSLPSPPLALMQVNLDEKERFRDLRAQKSLNTISPSSEEVRAYFRKEEVLRYSIPDRAFSYIAADGKKSIVAPLRRCGGKPTSKARDHFMLKRDRPPHVTILCLVRDAAARLPGSIGTRADVCTLIRDSQYIVEDVSDAQINQVVSGALDRLHYERDPCVQFDGERKLWVYLHREREEEDFEDDGTSSTKKWKRQKKDAADPSDQGAADQGTVTVACHGTGEQSGHDLCSDLNVDPPCIDDDKGMELLSTDTRVNAEDHVDVNRASEEGNGCEGNSMAWEALDLNPTRELCQENSTNEDFDGESFGGERPVGLLSASLL